MPLLRNKYQQYFPDPDAPNNMNCAGDYCNPLQAGDILYAQFYQTPCGDNIVEDPDFEDTTIGAEELTNGTFTGNANGWETVSGTLPNDNWAYSANTVVHTPGSVQPLFQSGLSLNDDAIYRCVVVMTRTAGSVVVELGDGIASTSSTELETTGTHTFDLIFRDPLDQLIKIIPSTDFDGSIDSISLVEVTYNDWDGNGDWFFSQVSVDGVLIGQVCKDDAGLGVLTETVTPYGTAGKRYRLSFTISSYGGQGQLAPTFAGAVDTDLLTVSANGNYQMWVTIAGPGVVTFTPTNDFTGCITNIDLREMVNDFQFEAITENGDGDVYDISSYVEYYQDFVTLKFDPDDAELPLGCFIIRAYDTCTVQYEEILVDGDFSEGLTHWNGAGALAQFDFTLDNGEFIYPIPVGFLQILSPLIITKVPDPVRIVKGANYRLSFEIISNSDPVNTGFRMGLGGEGSTGPWETAVGVHTFDTFIPDDIPDSQINYRVGGLANFNIAGAGTPASTQNIVVDNLSVRRIEPFTATYISECINFQSTHYNTKLLTAFCDNPAYGFEFTNSGFLLQMRMVVRSFAPNYPQDANIAKYGNGDAQVTYGESEKYWQLFTDFVSESAHDALAIMKISDHFLIGDSYDTSKEYITEPDDYQPQWIQDGSYSLAPSVINIRIKEGGQVFNRDL